MALNNEKESIVTVNNVSKRFIKSLDLAGKIAQRFGADIREEVVHAVDRVSLNIQDGEVVGLVGESGCGKSTLGRVVAGVHEPSEGNVLFRGKAIENLTGKDAQEAALKIQMIFQDPMSSLNPRLRVQDIIGEAPVVHGVVDSGNITDYVEEIMLRVGLDPSYARRYPHQFSGGQRQRIGIARALAVQPDFLVCDESVAALDVSIQAQVLNLFMRLRQELNLTYLFISHDLSVVAHVCDIVAVMYLGHIVEMAPSRQLFSNPRHSYTKALLSSIPSIDPENKSKAIDLQGEIPSAMNPPSGCVFRTRCPNPTHDCKEGHIEMGLIEVSPDHWVDQCCVNCG